MPVNKYINIRKNHAGTVLASVLELRATAGARWTCNTAYKVTLLCDLRVPLVKLGAAAVEASVTDAVA